QGALLEITGRAFLEQGRQPCSKSSSDPEKERGEHAWRPRPPAYAASSVRVESGEKRNSGCRGICWRSHAHADISIKCRMTYYYYYSMLYSLSGTFRARRPLNGRG